MSNWMNNAKSWLGLGNEPYEGTEDYVDDGYGGFDDEPAYDDEPEVVGGGTVTPLAGRDRDWDDDGGVRVLEADASVDTDNRGVVRPLPSASQPQLVVPDTFNDVQQVADTFRNAQPVILNLQGLDRDLSRRIIDFSSGLCYGLDGTMERVGDQVFLLAPTGVQISDDDRRRMRDGEY